MGEAYRRVLITGGLGYLGGRISTYLVASLPQLSLRLMTRRSYDRIPQWASLLDVVQGDVLDEESLEAALEGVDTVVHLAALNEIESQQDPDLALEVNGRGTYRMLRACHARRVRRFLYFSTFHVYGLGTAQVITEESPTRPVHPYSITHRLAEDFVNWYSHAYGLETLILRLSNGYGYAADPGVRRWSLVFNDLCLQAVQKNEITLRSQGTEYRDFISLTDVARGVGHLLGLPSGAWQDGVLNIGGECSLSIKEVARRVASEYLLCYGKEMPVRTGEARDPVGAGPVVYCIDKLKLTGFSLAGDMAEEIRGTLRLCEGLATPLPLES